MSERLAHDQDDSLRALHGLESAGAELAPAYLELKAELLERDARAAIREPEDDVVLLPAELVEEPAAAEVDRRGRRPGRRERDDERGCRGVGS